MDGFFGSNHYKLIFFKCFIHILLKDPTLLRISRFLRPNLLCFCVVQGPGMLKMHMRTHEQRPPKQPTCSVCQRQFLTKTLLYRHRQTHFEQKTHQCTFCEKRFFSGYALRSHMARHRGERPYICSNCNKSFYNPTDLKVRSIKYRDYPV